MATSRSYSESQRGKLYLANSMVDSIEECDLRGLDLLLRNHDADPNFIIPEKCFSPMHLVAAIHDENFAVKALELLFEHGGDSNVCGEESLTPVHVATSWDHGNVLKVLLENGGNPHLKDECGKDSFDYAEENDCIFAKHVLAQYGDTRKLLVRLKKLQAAMPYTVPPLGRRSRIFFRPSVLARVPDSPCVNSSSRESIEFIGEVCKHSEVDVSQHFSSSVFESGNEEQDNSIVFLEEVKCNSLSCKEPVVGGDSPSTPGNVADNGLNTYDIVDDDNLKPSPASDANCYSKSVSFGVMKNESAILTSESHDTADMGVQSINCGFRGSQDTCANDEESASFCKISPVSKTSKEISGVDILPEPLHSYSSDSLESRDRKSDCKKESFSFSLASFQEHEKVFSRESVARKRPSLRQSLMPKKQIPQIIINDMIEGINEDSGLDGNLQLNSASSDTYKSGKNISDSVGKLNAGTAESGLHASSSVSSTGTCVSECYLYTDEENGIALLEERWRSNPIHKSEAPQTDQSSSSRDVATTDTEAYDTESLRRELTSQGIIYGPITATTKKVYVKRLGSKRKLCGQLSKEESKFSFELQRSLRGGRNLYFVSLGTKLERQVAEEFAACGGDDRRRWREGCSKTSFNYLLLDPRITQNLPWRAPELAPERVWLIFLKSIFYIGKGKRSRPYSHLYEAVQHWNNQHPTRYMNKKVKQILDIWAEGFGVVCLHIFQNVIPVEAYTREAAMIDALGLDNLSNAKRSEYYGEAAKWISREQRILGVYLLDKAMTLFLVEGERQIRTCDLNS